MGADNAKVLWLLIVGHALGDFVLQNDGMAQRKNFISNPMPAVPWYYWLGAHALTHGGLVTLITGSALLGIAEAVLHAYIDHMKCAGKFSLLQDQLWHLAFKLLWALAAPAL